MYFVVVFVARAEAVAFSCEMNMQQVPEPAAILLRQITAFPAGGPQASSLEEAVGKVLASYGFHDEASCHFRRALEGATEERRHILKSKLQDQLLIESVGNTSPLYEQSLAARLDVGAQMNDLCDVGAALAMQGRYGQAIQTLERALLEDDAPGHLRGAGTRIQLGHAYYAVGQLPKARHVYAEALQVLKYELKENDPARVAGMMHLAQVDAELGDFRVAQQAALSAAKLLLPVTSIVAQQHSEQNKAAAAVLGRALRLQSEMLQRHVKTAPELGHKALTLALKASELQAQPLSRFLPDLARTLRALGNAQLLVGELDRALKSFQEASQLDEKTFGEFHATTAVSQSYVARALMTLQQHAAASALFEQSATALRAAHASEDLLGSPYDESMVFHNFAVQHWQHGHVQEANEYARSALEVLRAADVSEEVPRFKAVQTSLEHFHTERLKGTGPPHMEFKDMKGTVPVSTPKMNQGVDTTNFIAGQVLGLLRKASIL